MDRDARRIVVDWLIDVAVGFKFLPETVFTGVDILDRYWASRAQTHPDASQYQLVGAASLSLAFKFHEHLSSYYPSIGWISQNTISGAQLAIMEIHVGSALGWDLSHRTIFDELADRRALTLDRVVVLKRMMPDPRYPDICPTCVADLITGVIER